MVVAFFFVFWGGDQRGRGVNGFCSEVIGFWPTGARAGGCAGGGRRGFVDYRWIRRPLIISGGREKVGGMGR